MVRMTGKRALMEVLRAEGVRYIFGNPGTSEAPIMDALEEYPDIEYMLATQEGVAMGMADGYAIATGRPSFVNLHIETGLANGISLLHHAWEGNTPMVLTSGNKDVRKLAEGRTELTEMVRLFTKWSVEVTHPEQVPGVMRRAFNEARTPPAGPVFVGFSANALDGEADVDVQPLTRNYFRTAADPEAVEAAARVLAGASRPVMVVGDRLGQSRGAAEAVRLAELLGARVYASSYAEMNFPTGHPQFMGRVNTALPPGRATLSQGDVVLAVGANVFSGYFFVSGPALGSDTRLIHLDSAYAEIGKSEPTEIGIIADPRVGLGQLCDAVEGALSGSAREAAQGRAASIASEKAQAQAGWDRDLRDRWDARPMTAERMMTELAKALPPDAVISDDSITSRDAARRHGVQRAGQHPQRAGRRHRMGHGQHPGHKAGPPGPTGGGHSRRRQRDDDGPGAVDGGQFQHPRGLRHMQQPLLPRPQAEHGPVQDPHPGRGGRLQPVHCHGLPHPPGHGGHRQRHGGAGTHHRRPGRHRAGPGRGPGFGQARAAGRDHRRKRLGML